MKRRHYAIVLALGRLCHAWQAQFSQATQCEDMTVEWSATASEQLGPPFVARLSAFGLAPLRLDVPTSAWSDATRTGSYTFPMPWPGNTSFVATMDDGFAFGTGGVTGVQTVKSSSNSSCITSAITQPKHIFDVYGTFNQCSVLSMNWTEPATSESRITGFVPNGVAFQLDRPTIGSKSTTWNLNIPSGTAFMLMYEPSSGSGLTSPLLFSVGNGSDQACMSSGAYPSATATQTGLAQATLQPSSSAALPSTTSNSEGNAHNTSNLGPILGATLGVLAFLSALGLLFCFCRRRRRQRRAAPQSPGLAKEMNLNSNDVLLDLRPGLDHSSYHTRSPEGTVLPFVLPRPSHQEPSHATSKGSRQRTHATVQSRETLESESSHMHGTGTSQSSSSAPPVPMLPTFARREDDNPVFIQHEDGGSMPLPRAREVIELPPGYHQLPPQPPTRQLRPLPQPQPQPRGERGEAQGQRK
ncbi:hypothetical protein BDV93DRAFT_519404 [Ceratobasidium sp. AG-I]|nr:hypothetical protein BDV93DRAFT_519404 [Ceratobasidium sp. AG-I]